MARAGERCRRRGVAEGVPLVLSKRNRQPGESRPDFDCSNKQRSCLSGLTTPPIGKAMPNQRVGGGRNDAGTRWPLRIQPVESASGVLCQQAAPARASVRRGGLRVVQLPQLRPGAFHVAPCAPRSRRPGRAPGTRPGSRERAGRPSRARRGSARSPPSRRGPGRARGGLRPSPGSSRTTARAGARASAGVPRSRISKAISAWASAWSGKSRASSCSMASAPGRASRRRKSP